MPKHSHMYRELGGRPKYGELVGGAIGLSIFIFAALLLLVATNPIK